MGTMIEGMHEQVAAKNAKLLVEMLERGVMQPHHIADVRFMLGFVTEQVEKAIALCEARIDEEIDSTWNKQQEE